MNGRDLTLDLGNAPAGSDASVRIAVSGLPAGEWPIDLRWRDAAGRVTDLGTARFALVPALRLASGVDQERAASVLASSLVRRQPLQARPSSFEHVMDGGHFPLTS